MNKVHMRGYLTRDIEIRYTNSGMAISKTAIAVTRKFTSNGEKKEEVCFIDIDFFGRSAEIANQYLNKGSDIIISGRVLFSSWVDNNGVKRSNHSIVVEDMEIINTRTKAPAEVNQPSSQPSQQQQKQPQPQPKHQPSLDINEDEIPF